MFKINDLHPTVNTDQVILEALYWKAYTHGQSYRIWQTSTGSLADYPALKRKTVGLLRQTYDTVRFLSEGSKATEEGNLAYVASGFQNGYTSQKRQRG